MPDTERARSENHHECTSNNHEAHSQSCSCRYITAVRKCQSASDQILPTKSCAGQPTNQVPDEAKLVLLLKNHISHFKLDSKQDWTAKHHLKNRT